MFSLYSSVTLVNDDEGRTEEEPMAVSFLNTSAKCRARHWHYYLDYLI